ncbi:hypothetical protein IWQ62_002644 [Dispira parvispora]|uniref:Oxidoreductase-like domain-containing protein n=1 Tax=Dispira parvispora TaxID=1520584 RepID=A0A9W8E7T1_9FUNG|nr:hypothetical protein IWQ62_002644 [Dispira parvispora]
MILAVLRRGYAQHRVIPSQAIRAFSNALFTYSNTVPAKPVEAESQSDSFHEADVGLPTPEQLAQLVAELPPTPELPTDDMCCMSGCARCVWDIYNDDLHEFQTKLTNIQQLYQKANLPLPPKVQQLTSTASADQGRNPLAALSGDSASPPSPAQASLQAFMELEAKLGK